MLGNQGKVHNIMIVRRKNAEVSNNTVLNGERCAKFKQNFSRFFRANTQCVHLRSSLGGKKINTIFSGRDLEF